MTGICNTDLEIAKGYMDFCGIPGHEFVGVVLESPKPEWKGKRVVGEINCPCGNCDLCRRGLPRHCSNRSVLGILNRDGTFAKRLCLPVENLHLVPDSVKDEEAVFTEPLAAAFEILEQVRITPEDSVLVMGDGKLGLLCAQAINLTGCRLVMMGKHRRKLALLEGVPSYLPHQTPKQKFDIVVEVTGSPEGFNAALSLLRPRGTLVLKTTVAGKSNINLAPVVIDEITIIGSRCGPFDRALSALKKKEIRVDFLIEAIYPLEDILDAWKHAGKRGAKKILLKP